MIPRLNRQLFEATVFDSGALGLTTSVIHQFTEPGIYRASVRRDGRHVGETMFEVQSLRFVEGPPVQVWLIGLDGKPRGQAADRGIPGAGG